MNIACAVMAFNRPNYLKKTLESLKKNTLAHKVDWYVYIDGPVTVDGIKKSSPENVKQVTSVVREFLDYMFKQNTTVIAVQSAYNYGIAQQKMSVHSLFQNYDQVIIFEDDMIVSPYYLNLIINMQKQFPNDVVNAPARPKKRIMSDAKLKHVENRGIYFWGYSFTKQTFDSIDWSLFAEYCKDCGSDYAKRPGKMIREKYGTTLSSHDGILNKIFRMHGVKRVCTMLPRAKYIGEYGLHNNPSRYKNAGFGELDKYVYERDQFPYEFEWYNGDSRFK